MEKKLCSEFSEEEFNNIFDKVYEGLTSGRSPQALPKAFILGGQPGAGKTTLQDEIEMSTQNLVVINGDDFRELHPHFGEIVLHYEDEFPKHTQAFSNKMSNALIQKLSEEKFNIAIEGTLRTSEVPFFTCNMLKGKGYEVELYVLAVGKSISWQSTLDRYEKMLRCGEIPRATPREIHDEAVEKLPKNLELLYKCKAFDNIKIFTRERKCLYEYKARLTDIVVSIKEQRPSMRIIYIYGEITSQEDFEEVYAELTAHRVFDLITSQKFSEVFSVIAKNPFTKEELDQSLIKDEITETEIAPQAESGRIDTFYDVNKKAVLSLNKDIVALHEFDMLTVEEITEHDYSSPDEGIAIEIAVIGIQHHVGCTHTAFELAAFLRAHGKSRV